MKSVAIIGPNADKPRFGGYTPDVVRPHSPLEALRDHLDHTVSIRYAKGCDLTSNETSGFAEAIAAVEASDAVILFPGGSTQTAGEERDRADLDLTGQQESLIDAVTKAGKPTIVVLISGSPVTMSRWIDKVDGLLMAWYGGEEAGPAIAEVLMGTTNPSGRLPITFPRFTGQLPRPYNQRPYGRIGTLLEVPGVVDNVRYDPLFPFGHGLSYTTFLYSDLWITVLGAAPNRAVEITVTVINTGHRSGDEVAQLYLSMESCRITQPVQRLCAFRRISLEPGAQQTITFRLETEQLTFLNERLEPEVNFGKYSILVGGSCQKGIRGHSEIG